MFDNTDDWPCEQCGTMLEWIDSYGHRKYCSDRCRQAAYRQRKKEEQMGDELHGPMTITCEECGNDFYWPGIGRRPLYCGRTCNQRAYRKRKRARERRRSGSHA